jgi:predicted outer membrane protein
VELDDAAIATIAETISNGQGVRARIAKRLGHDTRVRNFAEHVLATLPGAMIATMPLAPRSSILDDELTSATQGVVTDLSLRRGTDFDREFLDSEQRSLTSALRLFDGTLIPKAVNEHLEERLTTMRAVLAQELSEAGSLVGALAASR